jgi:hypothetical protein
LSSLSSLCPKFYTANVNNIVLNILSSLCLKFYTANVNNIVLSILASLCLKFYTANVNNIGPHTLALNMSCHVMYCNVCLIMVTVTETCSKFYIIEYIVVFWLNDILVSATTASSDHKIHAILPNIAGYGTVARYVPASSQLSGRSNSLNNSIWNKPSTRYFFANYWICFSILK